MKPIPLLLSCALFFIAPSLSSGQEEPPAKRAALGLNYPGVSFKYPLGAFYAAEFKAQSAGGVTLAGVRFYRFFAPSGGVIPLLGLEADYLSYKGSDSKGSGMALGLAAGGETFLSKNLSLQLDFGPALIMVKDGGTGLSASGLEYVVNLGVNLYLGRGGSR